MWYYVLARDASDSGGPYGEPVLARTCVVVTEHDLYDELSHLIGIDQDRSGVGHGGWLIAAALEGPKHSKVATVCALTIDEWLDAFFFPRVTMPEDVTEREFPRLRGIVQEWERTLDQRMAERDRVLADVTTRMARTLWRVRD